MQVSLNPKMREFVEAKVKSGQFDSPDDVVNGALAVLKAQEVESAEDIEELRRLVAVGIEQLERGDSAPWDPEDLKRRVREAAAREKRAG
jgi:antitoxin ParD1/3/4